MRIVIITHAVDRLIRRLRGPEVESSFMLGPVLQALAALGHAIEVCRGIPETPPPGDLAVLHVDLTLVPEDYLRFGAHYPRCINLAVRDVSKRAVSEAVIRAGERWDGPVIVKTDLNYRGIAEARLAAAERQERTAPAAPEYRIYAAQAEIPEELAADPRFVIERFLPEREGDQFACRSWSFMGGVERCARLLGRSPIVKGTNATGFDYCDIPDELRAARARLGFDYGKLDFVLHEGKAVLIDANKTPGAPPMKNISMGWATDFARGLIALRP